MTSNQAPASDEAVRDALAGTAETDALFSTSGIRSDLKTRSVRSGFVNLGSQGVQLALGVGGTMVLARLLRPADFGLYAMVGTLISFIGSFRDFGLPLAAVQREALTHHEYSALFWLYQRINIGIVLVMIAAGPVLAWFYGQPQLTAITAVMAGGVFVLGLAVQQEGLLRRQMRFPTLTALDIAATFAGITTGITAAVLGAGHWALVLQFLAMCTTKSAGAWAVSRWRPARVHHSDERAATGIRRLFSFGLDVTAAGVIKHVGRNLDRVLVGYLAGPQALGLYHHADKWAHFPTRHLYAPLRHVAVSGLSRVQGEPATYRTYVRRGFLPVFGVTMPAIAFLFVESERVLGVLLGPQWIEAIPLFRILCVAAFVGKISTVTRWLFLSSGATRPLLRWDVLTTPITVASVAIGAMYGVRGVAIGFTIGSAVLVYPTLWYCLRHTPLRMRDFVRILARPATSAIAAAAVVMALQAGGVMRGGALLVLVLHGLVFSIAYGAVWLSLPGGVRATTEVVELVRSARRR